MWQATTLIPSVEFGVLPPLRRVWFLDNEGRDLIQIQEDRFVFNWKRNVSDKGYPGYDQVAGRFEQYLSKFVRFLESQGLGKPNYNIFELVYVNQLGPQHGMDHFDPSSVMVDHVRNVTRERFLPQPVGINWVTVYPLPEAAGFLHVNAQTSLQPGIDVSMRVDMVARGVMPDKSDVGRKAWFDLAHEWVTKGFSDVMIGIIQDEKWGRVS